VIMKSTVLLCGAVYSGSDFFNIFFKLLKLSHPFLKSQSIPSFVLAKRVPVIRGHVCDSV
jgi:hypothetical protein